MTRACEALVASQQSEVSLQLLLLSKHSSLVCSHCSTIDALQAPSLLQWQMLFSGYFSWACSFFERHELKGKTFMRITQRITLLMPISHRIGIIIYTTPLIMKCGIWGFQVIRSSAQSIIYIYFKCNSREPAPFFIKTSRRWRQKAAVIKTWISTKPRCALRFSSMITLCVATEVYDRCDVQ